MDVVQRDSVEAFVTKDTSIIREILAPRNSSVQKQSLAEAIVLPGATTQAHYHPVTEELYYILRGVGTMRLDGEVREVVSGDGIAIPPGMPHQIRNCGTEELVFLCCCVPAYEHDDTVLVPSLFLEDSESGNAV